MLATIAPTHPVTNRRTRRAAAAPAADARTLPMRAAVGVGVRVAAPNWMWILGGAVLGTLLLGPIGGIAGGIAGAMLVS
jgi:hypothetical protein